jgi:DNA-binding NtrC family response regulator
VRQHDGFIDVTSEVGEGTTFTLYFPKSVSTEAADVAPDISSLQSGQGQTLLVVEDDPAIRQALVDSLILLNYQVIEAQNGRIALSILAERAPEIELVLSDVVMPEIGGVALLYAARQQGCAMPFVLLTGHPLSKEMQNIQTTGFVGWLSKPPDLVSLSQLLAEAIANKFQ